MADATAAFDFVMQHEDPKLEGKVTPDPTSKDPHAVARFGVNSAAHPELVASGFFDAARMPKPEALLVAVGVFRTSYFNRILGALIHEQSIANKFADLAFNEGPPQAAKIVQRALASILTAMQPRIKDDGVVGTLTIAAINACEPERLLPAIKAEAVKFYREVVAEHPQFANDLDGWISRANS